MASGACYVVVGPVPRRDDAPAVVREPGHPVRDVLSDLGEGFAYMWRTPWLWASLFFVSFLLLMVMGPIEVLVPFALRDKSGNLYGAARGNYQQAMESTGDRMESYRYPHSYPGGWVKQQYLPDGMEPPGWYQPKDIGYEREVKARLAALKGDGNA